MKNQNKNKIIEGSIKDTILYTTLFNRKLKQLTERNTANIFFWLCLIEKNENLPTSKIGKKFNVSKSQMTSRIDNLVNEGLVERVSDTNDRRIIKIQLTPKGKEFIKENQIIFGENMSKEFSALNEKDLEDLKRSISIIKKIILKI